MHLAVSKESHTQITDNKFELKLNKKDLETLQQVFSMPGEDNVTNLISLNREQFVEALSLVLFKGTHESYSELFDKIDITRQGFVDWDKVASHLLLDFYEKEDRTKSSSLPQWKDLKTLSGTHKDLIQGIIIAKNLNRYLTIGKDGNVSLWSADLKLLKNAKAHTESCKSKDLWVTDFAYMANINKVAVCFTSQEIAFYDVGAKLEFNCQIRLQNLLRIPICMDYWSHPENTGEAILVWGDVEGYINILSWKVQPSLLFERTDVKPSDKDELMTIVTLSEIIQGSISSCSYCPHKAHDDWVRKVLYLSNLECFVSCATNWNTSMVICWLEKHNPTSSSSSELAGSKDDLFSESSEGRSIAKTSSFTVHQGINSFAYNENINLIATAGVNFHVCLWNPYVVSKPNGLLRGHMTSVSDVQFNKTRGLLFSFSKDKVLRVWDVQLQVCIQKLNGIFPKGQESVLMNPRITLYTKMYYHEEKMRLFITFNFALTVLEMKPDMRNKIQSHQEPLIGCLYNSLYNQVVTACQGGVVYCWMVDTGQRVKTLSDICGPNAEMTCITQDVTQTRLYTGDTDGNVKIWDFNGHCYHTLICADGKAADIGQIAILKRCILVLGFSKQITAFWTSNFKDHKVYPTVWGSGQGHDDDILAGASIPPHGIATGGYDGEIIIWNINSEHATRRMDQRSQKVMKQVRQLAETAIKQSDESVNQEPNTPGISFKMQSSNKQLMKKMDSASFLLSDSILIQSALVSSETSSDTISDMVDCMFNISRLIYLETRKKIKEGVGANLVSCGGNGIVRFWNYKEGWLVGEFVAHENASSIIMNIDDTNHYIATGDMDGHIKIWDISDYCLTEVENESLMKSPPLVSEWQSHSDEISGIAFCHRFERTLIITSSADLSAGLWELTGILIGRFGQDLRWKLSSEMERSSLTLAEDNADEIRTVDSVIVKYDPYWVPDPKATQNPSEYRINTWDDTILGKDYQELRSQKRERIQPNVIPNLPYIFGDKFGRPTFGPFYSLGTFSFEAIDELEVPEFMDNPDKYFTETPDYLLKAARVSLVNEDSKGISKSPAPGANTSNILQNSNDSNRKNRSQNFTKNSFLPKYLQNFETNIRNRLKLCIADSRGLTLGDRSDRSAERRPRRGRNVLLQPIDGRSKLRNKRVKK